MAYALPTPATLKARYPVFVGVADSIVQSAIDEAARSVDTSWTSGDYTNAITLLACHILTLDGYPGTGGVGGGTSAYRSVRSGQLTLERFAKGQVAGDDGSLLGSTPYGRRYLELLAVNRGGPIVAAGAVCPPYGWPV